ncbi:hypothetical protein PN482_09745 [Microcystis aeruginosa CS-555/01A07]|uniref:hypothetical protein n=1 Tax=Microcystis aeruginosa TaxID=1126 RepID=UPI00232A9AA8|nr:hypothetical protein [Microcystis aeruginosa]MDB9429172.1 hypothetical protein [Microcystis aeruginosa CS-555/01A07]
MITIFNFTCQEIRSFLGAPSHLNPQLQLICMVRSPKIDRRSSRSHIRERTLRLFYQHSRLFIPLETNRTVTFH